MRAALLLLVLLVLPAGIRAADAPDTAAPDTAAPDVPTPSMSAPAMAVPLPPAPTVTEVEVTKVKPERPKHPTLRFLKENRDFLRAQLDLLRQTARERAAGAGALDPRYLTYQEMLSQILAAKDSTAASADALERLALLDSIKRLGDLETQLDLFERLLAEQRDRLAILQDDFTGRQETALIVLLSGSPVAIPPAEVAITLEDSTTVRVPLAPEHRESLAHGGIAQLFHGFVEPREQVVAVTLSGATGTAGDTSYVVLEPARDRLTFLRLHLAGSAGPGAGPDLKATTWLLEADTRLGAR